MLHSKNRAASFLSGTYVLAAGAVSTGSASTTTVAYPSGIQANDLLLIDGWVNSAAMSSTPAGWDATFNTAFEPCFFKVATGSETGSVTINKNTTAAHGLVMLRIRYPYTTPKIVGGAGDFAASGTSISPVGNYGNFLYNGKDLVIIFIGYTTGSVSATSPTATANLAATSPQMYCYYWANQTGNISYTSSTAMNYRVKVINIG